MCTSACLSLSIFQTDHLHIPPFRVFTNKEPDDVSIIETPYGGRLMFVLPEGNMLYVHLKDKLLIRNKKRWSQVQISCESFYLYIPIYVYVIVKYTKNQVLSLKHADLFSFFMYWNCMSLNGPIMCMVWFYYSITSHSGTGSSTLIIITQMCQKYMFYSKNYLLLNMG